MNNTTTLVGIDDFLSSYYNGIRQYYSWFSAKELLAARTPHQEVARKVGNSKRTVFYWATGRKPTGVTYLHEAMGLDLVPLTTTSEKLVPLNRLAAKVFWTGCLAENTRLSIYGEQEHLESIQTYFKKTLGLESNIHVVQDGMGELLFLESHLFGRTLMGMGVPLTSTIDRLPRYINSLLSISPPPNSLERGVLEDFVKVFFEEKFTTSQKSSQIQLVLQKQKTRKQGLRYGAEAINLLNYCLPGLNLTIDDHLYCTPINDKKSKKKHELRINLKVEGLRQLVQSHRAYIQLSPPQNSWSR
jgi:hypothetical protein